VTNLERRNWRQVSQIVFRNAEEAAAARSRSRRIVIRRSGQGARAQRFDVDLGMNRKIRRYRPRDWQTRPLRCRPATSQPVKAGRRCSVKIGKIEPGVEPS